LAKCEECRKRLLSEEQLQQAIVRLHRQISTAAPTDCITYDLLADYIDGQFSREESAKVEEHSKVCAVVLKTFALFQNFAC